MRIGELAKRTGTTTRTLRFYEEQGLLDADRAANGYRDYSARHQRLITEIQTLQSIGFSLDETRPFVDCLRAGHEAGDSCGDSIQVYRRKIAEVDALLSRLSAVRTELHDKLAGALDRQPFDPCRMPDPQEQS